MALSTEDQHKLRAAFDQGLNKRQAGIQLGIAEATVYRYYVRWQAVTSKTTIDIAHLDPKIVQELEIQARMRRMTLYAFVFKLLTTVAEDGLAVSIIDIPEHSPVKKRLVNVKS